MPGTSWPGRGWVRRTRAPFFFPPPLRRGGSSLQNCGSRRSRGAGRGRAGAGCVPGSGRAGRNTSRGAGTGGAEAERPPNLLSHFCSRSSRSSLRRPLRPAPPPARPRSLSVARIQLSKKSPTANKQTVACGPPSPVPPNLSVCTRVVRTQQPGSGKDGVDSWLPHNLCPRMPPALHLPPTPHLCPIP